MRDWTNYSTKDQTDQSDQTDQFDQTDQSDQPDQPTPTAEPNATDRTLLRWIWESWHSFQVVQFSVTARSSHHLKSLMEILRGIGPDKSLPFLSA